MSVTITKLEGTTEAQVLTINAPGQELVADVLFSYGNPVAAIIYLSQEVRKIIDWRGDTGKMYNGKLTTKHINLFLFQAKKENDPRNINSLPAYLTGEDKGEDNVIPSLIVGKMPDYISSELLYS